MKGPVDRLLAHRAEAMLWRLVAKLFAAKDDMYVCRGRADSDGDVRITPWMMRELVVQTLEEESLTGRGVSTDA